MQKLMVAVTLTMMVSACAGTGTQQPPPAGYAQDAQSQHERAYRDMKQRKFADPQVPGWVNVNPQEILFIAEP
jgi:hypothetical protein